MNKVPYVPWSFIFTREAKNKLLEMGKEGGYIFSPSHAVGGDTPVMNIIAFISEARRQVE